MAGEYLRVRTETAHTQPGCARVCMHVPSARHSRAVLSSEQGLTLVHF
jgi:hypothetical protein